jgi:phosphoglycerate dehydrogenase-like enzyme
MDVTHESWLETRRLTDPDDLARRLEEEAIGILVVESDFVFEEVFEEAEALRFVGICRAATNHVEIDAATLHGVVVVNTPARNTQAVAEHVLGLMLSLARGIPAAHRYVVEGRWESPVEPYISMRGSELAGKHLGIVGLGAIGKRVAEIGLALGMEVVAHDPYIEGGTPGVTMVALDDLVAGSDYVSIHVPSTAKTEGLLDGRRLSLMKPTAYLVNTSDASVVEQGPLIEALRDRRIAGAAFDVFESHPISPQNPLLALDNVVLTPHLGGATGETVERHSRMMTDDILRFLDGQRPKNLVNPGVWERSG